jgi:predicted dehydrogenase
MGDLRIGILGAAAIAPSAVIRPSTEVAGVVVQSVASRDRDRAEALAAKRGIPRVTHDYDALLGDPDLDAVHIALPNSLHGAWTVPALSARKHVLCEKPFTANAAEAERVAVAVAATDRIVMEAFHRRYRPLARRAVEVWPASWARCVGCPPRSAIRCHPAGTSGGSASSAAGP